MMRRRISTIFAVMMVIFVAVILAAGDWNTDRVRIDPSLPLGPQTQAGLDRHWQNSKAISEPAGETGENPPVYAEVMYVQQATPTYVPTPYMALYSKGTDLYARDYLGNEYNITSTLQPIPTSTPTVGPGTPTNTPHPTSTPTPGYLKQDGSTPLTADWDAGAYQITADGGYTTTQTASGGSVTGYSSTVSTSAGSVTEYAYGATSLVTTYTGADDWGYGFRHLGSSTSTGGTQVGFSSSFPAATTLDTWVAFHASDTNLTCSNTYGFSIEGSQHNYLGGDLEIGTAMHTAPLTIMCDTTPRGIDLYGNGTTSAEWSLDVPASASYFEIQHAGDPKLILWGNSQSMWLKYGITVDVLRVRSMATPGYVMNNALGDLSGGNPGPTPLPTPTPHNYWGTLYDDDADKLIPSAPDRELHIVTEGGGHSDVYTATDDYLKITIYTPVPTYTPHSEVWSTATPTPSTQTGQQRFNTDYNIWESWNPTAGDWVPMRICSAPFCRNSTGLNSNLIYTGYLYYTARWEVSQSLLLYGLDVSVNNDLSAGQSYTITVKVNGTATALTATVSGDATGNKGAGHGTEKYIEVSDGDNIMVTITAVSGGASTANKIAAQLLYIPRGI